MLLVKHDITKTKRNWINQCYLILKYDISFIYCFMTFLHCRLLILFEAVVLNYTPYLLLRSLEKLRETILS